MLLKLLGSAEDRHNNKNTLKYSSSFTLKLLRCQDNMMKTHKGIGDLQAMDGGVCWSVSGGFWSEFGWRRWRHRHCLAGEGAGQKGDPPSARAHYLRGN
jgi:hypothetical protein